MPQNRRKVPFSGKAKKEQLKAKKHRQCGNAGTLSSNHPTNVKESSSEGSDPKVFSSNSSERNRFASKYALRFFEETNEDIKKRKELAYKTITKVAETELDIDGELYFTGLDFPKRPAWSYDLSKEQLDALEQSYFHEYISKMKLLKESEDLGFFELNLETWRQLWRVTEMSDIVLFIVDARYGSCMFPPYFYEYIVKTLKKDFVLILNKIDLVQPAIVVAWKNYFMEKYPDIHIVMFTSAPAYNLRGTIANEGLLTRRRKGKVRMAVEGAEQIYTICKTLVENKVDLSTWLHKIEEELLAKLDEYDTEVGEILQVKNESGHYEYKKYEGNVLTIGCVGQPNAGKSSVINALMGKKVVSVSRTPGHTKYFQTIYLTKNVKLCDCPGLVFPSKVPKTLQVLMGSFPIAQLREPFTTVKYLAERLDMEKLLKIDHPDNDETWSAMDICDGWAKKRGYVTAKAARLDSYRAANSLLRMALDGKICLNLRPVNYTKSKEFWEVHPDVEKVKHIRGHEDKTPIDSDTSEHSNSTSTESYSESSDNEDASELFETTNKFSVFIE